MNNFIESINKLFNYYKQLGEKSINSLDKDQLNYRLSSESNSIAIIVKHLSGNMQSRFTDFLNSDGEKSWRNRDGEFEGEFERKDDLLIAWDKGWNCLLDALRQLDNAKLDHVVYIRNEGHTVMEALHRQLAHYSYHVGQIVFIAKSIKNEEWQSLSIPKGHSDKFNAEKFQKEKERKHFTG